MKRPLQLLTVAAATTTLLALGASGASAHVSVDPDTTTAGSYALLTFGVPHGCGESATTKVSIQIPEPITSVTPTVNPGWDVEKVMVTLATPIDDGHGGQLTERVGEIVYTARAPLPDGYRDALVLSTKLPDTVGETLVFPTVQTCQEGESAWVQVAAEGEDPHDLDLPAPVLTVTAAEDEAAHGDTETVSDESATVEAVAAPAEPSSTPLVLSWVAVVLGAAGLALGGAAFVRGRRSQG
ncbi:YcnI family protein [Oerskovia sp. Root918]|uniref:YcnI family copper-binding membrane protein n=1 Tax=Oerskovia sp. Root918 TaxID=1736607 RepID=UPI0009ECB08D|nr:YcnI family protein [Oerskovia sp. Root918]